MTDSFPLFDPENNRLDRLPDLVVERILEASDWISRLQVSKAHISFNKFARNIKTNITKLEVKLLDDKLEHIITTSHGEINMTYNAWYEGERNLDLIGYNVTNGDNLISGRGYGPKFDYRQAACEDLEIILSNKNLKLEHLKILTPTANRNDDTLFIWRSEYFSRLLTVLKSLQHKLHVEKIEMPIKLLTDIKKILSFIKPEVLNHLELTATNLRTAHAFNLIRLTDFIRTEHWRQIKFLILHMNDLSSFDFSDFLHFNSFEIEGILSPRVRETCSFERSLDAQMKTCLNHYDEDHGLFSVKIAETKRPGHLIIEIVDKATSQNYEVNLEGQQMRLKI